MKWNKLTFLLITLVVGVGLYLLWQWHDHSSKQIPLSAEQAVVAKFECYRCHEMASPFDEKTVDGRFNCRLCHQRILQGKLDADYSEKTLLKWKKNIRHLTEVPSLKDLHKRIQRQWFIDYLQNPTIIRPHLLSMMPRLPISEQEATVLADYFLLKATDTTQKSEQQQGDVVKGALLFTQKGCNNCHLFSLSNNKTLHTHTYPHFHTVAVANKAKQYAPDLRYTRQRMSPQQITQWLRDPKQVKPDTLMPDMALTETDITHLVTYILTATPTPTHTSTKDEVKPPPFEKPVALTRSVRYQEVEKKIFKALCWHCHSDPKGNWGDGGAGNTGGFGYVGVGLDLGSYETIVRGSQQADGSYRSILQKGSKEYSILVRHLLARHNEMRGYSDPDMVGMPLALPPLTREQIQLIVSWIEQGAKK